MAADQQSIYPWVTAMEKLRTLTGDVYWPSKRGELTKTNPSGEYLDGLVELVHILLLLCKDYDGAWKGESAQRGQALE